MRSSKRVKLKLKLKSQIQFFSILAQMLANGFSIHQALRFMQDFLPEEQAWLYLFQDRLQQGQTLAQALAFGQINQMLVDQITIAQQHGHLVESLSQIGQWLKIKEQQQNKLKQLLNYPILLVGLLVIFFGLSRILIQPQVQNLGGKAFHLPWWFWAMLLCLGGLCLIVSGLFNHRLKHSNALEKAILWIRVPFLVRIFRIYYHYLLCLNLAIFLANGLNLVEILGAVQQLSKRSFLNRLGYQIEKGLQSGQSLEKIIKNSEILPNELISFLYRGASIQLLAEEMRIYSQLLFGTLEVALNKVLLKIQPIAFMIIALLILFMYLQLLLPIYNMMGQT